MASTNPEEVQQQTTTSEREETIAIPTTELPVHRSSEITTTNDDLPPAYESRPAADATIETSPFRAEDFAKDGKTHILLAVSGSVACIKLPNIISALASSSSAAAPVTNLAIRIVLTEAATHFFSGVSDENPTLDSLRRLPNVEAIYTDADEWAIPWQRGNAILHIELRKWADIGIVVPLDANSLAKMTNGISDNLLLSILRAWDHEGKFNPAGRQYRYKYLLVAPAMNTAMWLHPVTKKQIKVLEDDWAEAREFHSSAAPEPGRSNRSYKVMPWAKVLRPMEKELACGDTGVGAMMDWKEIVKEIKYQAKKFG